MLMFIITFVFPNTHDTSRYERREKKSAEETRRVALISEVLSGQRGLQVEKAFGEGEFTEEQSEDAMLATTHYSLGRMLLKDHNFDEVG
jgi:hypothetical protein